MPEKEPIIEIGRGRSAAGMEWLPYLRLWGKLGRLGISLSCNLAWKKKIENHSFMQ